TVAQGLEMLKARGLVSRISGAGHRVEKWGHRLGEWNLGRREMSLLCVLMLRGPQTVGELRGRTGRMHNFGDLEEVERLLESLAHREVGALVAPAGRGRWMHVLGDPAEIHAEADALQSRDRTPLPSGEGAVDHNGGLEQRVATLEREV